MIQHPQTDQDYHALTSLLAREIIKRHEEIVSLLLLWSLDPDVTPDGRKAATEALAAVQRRGKIHSGLPPDVS